jgi:uncharacterized membrane protein
MHVFGVIVWLGGLMFQNAVAHPIAKFEPPDAMRVQRKINQRFTGFVWMCAWTIGVTGVIMMLASPRFLWLTFDDRWSVMLAVKEIIFLLMVFYAFGHARMLAQMVKEGAPDETVVLAAARANQFRTISIFLGISAMLLATAMV